MMEPREAYKVRYETFLSPIAESLEKHIKENLEGIPRIDRISSRAKRIDSFLKKSEKVTDGKKKYSNPFKQIQDQIGVRIIVLYLDDIDAVSKRIEDYYRKIEHKVIVPDSDNEFGYFGKHFILLIPDDIISDDFDQENIPNFFELQVKTVFQHAWSEAEHDLGYKPEVNLTSETKRKIAFTSAQAWGADQIFNELFKAAND